MLGFSCDYLYYSRYFIHEMYFVFFTLGIYLGMIYYLSRNNPRFLFLVSTCAAFLYCTKETSLLTFFVLFFSGVCVEVTYYFLGEFSSEKPAPVILKNVKKVSIDFFSKPENILIALAIWIFLYSSIGFNWRGIPDSVRTYMKWSKEGVASGHVKPFVYFMSP